MSETTERPTPLDALADRIDRLADAQPAGSQAQADLYAAATVWRKHLLGPQYGPRDDSVWMLIEEDAPIDAPLDVTVLLAWWDEWSGAWRFETGYAGSERGGWRHGRATHWRPLPAPPVHVSDDAHAISDAMRMTDDGEIREVRAPASRSDGGIRYDAMMEHGLSIFSEGSPAARTDGDIHDGSEA